METALRKRRLARIGRLVAAVAVVVGLWIGARHVDFAGVAAVLARADARLLLTAVPALLALNLVLRSARFYALARSLPAPAPGPLTFREASTSFLASLAANNVLPLRLGELVRTRDLVRRGYGIGAVAFVQVTEKGVELVTLIACSLPLVPLGLVRLPTSVAKGLGLVAALTLVLVALGVHRPLLRWIASRAPALRRAVGKKAVASSLAWSLAADVAELVLIGVCLASLHVAPSWQLSLAVYVGINLAIAVPSTPGQVGAFEAGGALALVWLGVPPEDAVAFALLYRVVQWGPTTVVGLALWLTGRRVAPPPNAPALR